MPEIYTHNNLNRGPDEITLRRMLTTCSCWKFYNLTMLMLGLIMLKPKAVTKSITYCFKSLYILQPSYWMTIPCLALHKRKMFWSILDSLLLKHVLLNPDFPGDSGRNWAGLLAQHKKFYYKFKRNTKTCTQTEVKTKWSRKNASTL